MYYKEDAWMLRNVFRLSNLALIRMVNHLFRTEYHTRESVWKEWQEEDMASVCVKVGGMNRYEFRLRRLESCIQISVEDRGCIFCYENMAVNPVVQIREPQIVYFGKGKQEKYSTTLEFPGNERVMLPVHIITLENCSAAELEERGLILFLPFLFYCFSQQPGDAQERQEALKRFMIQDITGALARSYQKGDLTAFDVQKLRQFCRQMAWKVFGREKWMQEPEMQELIMDMLDVDLDFLERMCRLEYSEARNR